MIRKQWWPSGYTELGWTEEISRRRRQLMKDVKALGLTQAQVGRRAGCAQSIVSRIITGHGERPSHAMEEKVLAVLGQELGTDFKHSDYFPPHPTAWPWEGDE